MAGRRHGVLQSATSSRLWPPPPDFGRQFLGWLSGRIREKHWAFGDEHDTVAVSDPGQGDDPLAAIEALHK